LFGSPEAASGPLVDNNPASSYSSQVYFNSMRFGDDQTGIADPAIAACIHASSER
jgi:hypothetical protein